MSIFTVELLSIKDVWTKAWQLYKKSFARVWYYGLLLGTISFAEYMLFNNIKVYIVGVDLANGQAHLTSIIILTLLQALLGVAINTYVAALILFQTNNLAIGQTFSFKDSISFINKKYLKLILGMLLVDSFCALGFALLIVPGVFIFIMLLMVQPLILFENLGVLNGIQKSWQLVRGNWWHVFSLLLPLLLTIFILYIADFTLDYQGLYLRLIELLISSFFYPIFCVFILTIYNDLRQINSHNMRLG